MESARSFYSKSRDASFFLISANKDKELKKDSKLNSSLSGRNQFNKDELKKGEESADDEAGMTSKGGKELNDLMQRYEILRTRGSNRINSQREAEYIRDIQARCIKMLIDLILGRRTVAGDNEAYGYSENSKLKPDSKDVSSNFSAINASERNVGIIAYNRVNEHYYEEQEDVSFKAEGIVRTADGRDISFGIDVEMSRSLAEYTKDVQRNEMVFVDPLVINLDGNVDSVSDMKFRFDLDCDGEAEEISNTRAGSAFIALDKNNDGIINDGSELFGAESGNGFADLAEYDEDKNGWIDENDSVFSRLVVFKVKEDGTQELLSLKDAGVGAMYLGSKSTDFTLDNTPDGSVAGRVRRTGVFLYENGMAGTLQQVDLATG